MGVPRPEPQFLVTSFQGSVEYRLVFHCRRILGMQTEVHVDSTLSVDRLGVESACENWEWEVCEYTFSRN